MTRLCCLDRRRHSSMLVRFARSTSGRCGDDSGDRRARRRRPGVHRSGERHGRAPRRSGSCGRRGSGSFPAQQWAFFEAIWSVLAATAPIPPENESLLRPYTRWLRTKGLGFSGVDYAEALTGVQRASREAAQVWAPYDLILSPTLARIPALVGELRNDDEPAGRTSRRRSSTRPGPACGTSPACGRSACPCTGSRWPAATLPIGIMLGGRHGSEETCWLCRRSWKKQGRGARR